MASLTDILVLHGALPLEALDTSAGGDDRDSIRGLLERGELSEAQVARAIAAQAGVDFVELTDYPVDRAAVAQVPAAICRRYVVLPLEMTDEVLTLAMAEPSDVFALDDVSAAAGRRIAIVVAARGDLQTAIARYHRADDELNHLSSALERESEVQVTGGGDTSVSDSFDDAPIVRFVNLLVSQAIQDRASDIHIEPGENELRVRYRIDGVLHEMQSAPRQIQNGVISRLKIMSDIDIAERRKPQDGRMSVTHAGRKIDLRVATLPTVWGEKVVMRILDTSGSTMQLTDLTLLDHNFEVYRRSYSKPYGMILVTGPTGSGKSTTLYSTLQTVSRPEINVITVEDPVEYRMPGINQVQVNPKAGLTFASALRSILRSDPDVVLLGEIRDHETAQIAVEAALTGHLVLSTLHTNDAPSAITRLTEMGIEPFLVGSALDCVVAQRLARKLCDRCKEPYHHDRAELNRLGLLTSAAADLAPVTYRAVGCALCSGTGYRGRVAVHEVMPVTEDIERHAVARSASADIARTAREQGMLTLREDGWAKVALGLTTVDEVLRVVA
jgi:type IV pilus assembly protein PilB